MASVEENFGLNELQVPEWLNADFIRKILQNCENDNDIEIEILNFSPATARGEHYASVMFRANVSYKCIKSGINKSRSLIIKTLPEYESNKKEMLQDSPIFETEIGMYSRVLPKLESMLRAIGDRTVFTANCLYHSLNPKKVIVFEDLIPLGYMAIRDREVTLDEVKIAYLKLAKFHATSLKLSQEQPAVLDDIRYGAMTMTSWIESDFFSNGMSRFISALDVTPTLVKYKPYFVAMKKDLIENCKKSFNEYRINRQDNGIYAVCHGDFHFKNMLFKHNPSNKLEDILCCDFQLSYVGSIANDIIYSFYMLLMAEHRANHFDELLYYYFTHFTETLRKIGYKGRIPKLMELREQLLRHRHNAIYMLTTFLPFWYAYTLKKVDPDELMNAKDDSRDVLYTNKEYIKELHTILPRYLELGYLEN